MSRFALAAVALLTAHGTAQQIVRTYAVEPSAFAYAARPKLLGDVDGDGVADHGLQQNGPSLVISGRDGSLLRSLPRGLFCTPPLGDIDQDGVDDFAHGGFTGVVLYLSGGTTQRLTALGNPTPAEVLGNLGDIDGDGAPELAALGTIYSVGQGRVFRTLREEAHPIGDVDGDGAADYYTNRAAAIPRIPTLYSGRSGAILIRLPDLGTISSGCITPYFLDLEGDGADDFAYTAGGKLNAHRVIIYSSATQARMTWNGTQIDAGPAVGDLDGDGISEVSAGPHILSGATLNPRFTLPHDVLEPLGDIDGDRQPEFFLRSSSDEIFLWSQGRTDLLGDPTVAAAGSRQVQSLTLRNPYNPRAPFLILGSVSGTAPGTPLPGGATLPLNLDPYTRLATAPAWIAGAAGVLSATGDATVQLGLPPTLPAGITLHHAYVVLGGAGIQYVSRPTSLALY